ncbi:MAG: putative multidrug resistance protein [Pseudonocardiales bacterium]|nr:putative multidrug resistance protein [Jatrophihabitantaceae bacterium]MCW2603395.1 putative multidrug resistance protein [Pseudonocardiales bacterium]
MSRPAATADSPAATLDSPPAVLTHKQILSVLSGLLLGMFLAALDQTVVSTAIRTIGDDLHGLSIQAWVTTAFLITSTISTPIYGKLSDIYGRKPLFLLAITIFVVGSTACAFATSMYMLAGSRALQGIGAGGLMSMAFAIMADIIPPRERAKYQGYFMAVFGSSSVLGPVVGGFLSGQDTLMGLTGWRWIFLVNVPLGILALFVVVRVLKVPHIPQPQRIDWWGALSLVVGLVPLLLIAEQGRVWGWDTPRAFACYVVGAAGLAAFVYIEGRMGDAALLPLRLFRNGTFAIGSAQSFVIGMGMFGGIAIVPLYLQIVKGASPTEAGLLTLPMVVGIMSASAVSGMYTSRTGKYRMFPIMGSSLLILGYLALSRVGADTSLVYTDACMLIMGWGLGLNMQTIILAMQNAVPPRDTGVATSSTTFFRSLGGTLGTAIFLSVLFSTVTANITGAFRDAGMAPTAGGDILNDSSFLSSLTPEQAHPYEVGFSQSMSLVFLLVAASLVICLILSILMKEVPLRLTAGNQAMAEEMAQDKALGDNEPSGSVSEGASSGASSGGGRR